MSSIVSGAKQKNYNYKTINNELYNLINQNTSTNFEDSRDIFAEFKDGDRIKMADYLDSVHHHFGIQESIDIQEISNLLRTAEALTTGDIELAQKLSPELIITDTVDDIVKAIDSSFNKYVWKTTYSMKGTDLFSPDDILNQGIYHRQ